MKFFVSNNLIFLYDLDNSFNTKLTPNMNLNNIRVSEKKQKELLSKAEDVIDTVSEQNIKLKTNKKVQT